jgi:hypothetical protein
VHVFVGRGRCERAFSGGGEAVKEHFWGGEAVKEHFWGGEAVKEHTLTCMAQWAWESCSSLFILLPYRHASGTRLLPAASCYVLLRPGGGGGMHRHA